MQDAEDSCDNRYRSQIMQDPNVATIAAGFISGLLSGGIAALGAWYAVRSGVSDLEATERRRQKIACVINLYGLRYVLSPGPVQRDEDRTQFMFEIGRAGALFADDSEAQKKLRDFYSAVTGHNRLQAEVSARANSGAPDASDAGRLEASSYHTTAILVAVIKELSRSANFPVQSLSNSDVREIFTMNLTNPAGLSTVVVNAPSASQLTTARIGASQLLSMVQSAAKTIGVEPQSIEAIYSRLPPPPDEPHVVRFRSKDGRTAVVRTPGDMSAAQVQGLILADLKREFEVRPAPPH